MATKIRLAEDEGVGLELTIAPLTVTANPKQGILVYRWQSEWWHDEATGWRGVWAVIDYASTGRRRAVRVRIMDDWPLLRPSEFFDVIEAAVAGRRLPTLADDQRLSEQLAAAPIAPVEDLGHTVTAQVRGLVGKA